MPRKRVSLSWGAPWSCLARQASTEAIPNEVVSPQISIMAPVRGTRMYIPFDLVNPLLSDLARRSSPGWRLQVFFAPNLPEGGFWGV
jgi:hypothetical protein